MKRVAICQSNYIPWKGYFDLIHDVDVFLFYDDVQFTVRDWRNRNKIKTAQGSAWLTIPVGSDRNRLICEVALSSNDWQATHWRRICQHYGKAPYFKKYESFFRWIYLETTWHNLSEFNQFLIEHISRECLGSHAQFLQSSNFGVTSRKQDRIFDLVQAVGADVYLSGPAGKAYLDPERFRRAGIELVWKDYADYPEYPQFHSPFEHAVTILDVLFHTGDHAPYYIWGWRTDKRLAMNALN